MILGEMTWGESVDFVPSVQVYDRQGAPLRGFLSSKQTYVRPVPLAEISPWVLAAAVCAEDKRFFTHDGVDMLAVLRATWQNVREGAVVSGASTITQQVVRSQAPYPKNWYGKFSEALQARATEKTQSKEEILETYLNVIELGNLTQGIEAASLFYFGINAKDLSAAQSAFLVGIAKSPTHYNPLQHFSRASKRQQYVLKRMFEEGFLEQELYDLAKKEKIELQAKKRPFYAPHFMQWLKTLLDPQVTEVYTSLDRSLQLQIETIVKNQLKNLTKEHVTNAAVIVLENETGEILAYVGSGDFSDKAHQGQVDGVRALRQPGSALKPFVYGLAFEKGVLTPSSLLQDEDTFFEGGFRPRNYDEKFHGNVSVRQSLACSYNIPAVQTAEKVGVNPLLSLLHQFGFTSLTKGADFYGLGLALGNGEVRLLELTNAYATLARLGRYQPIVLAREPYIQLPGVPRRVLSEQSSYLITDILKDNQARSPAFGLNSPLALPFEIAAKTGTSKDYKDNFAVGYTPRWTIGVWVGNFDASSMQQVSGVTGAGPILHDVAIYLQEKYPSTTFVEPSGIVHHTACKESGLLAGATCQSKQLEIFDQRKVPPVCDGKHDKSPAAVRILSPVSGDVYKWDPAVTPGSQRLKWAASCPTGKCQWVLDGRRYPSTSCNVFWELTPGTHTLAVTCDKKKDLSTFEVLP